MSKAFTLAEVLITLGIIGVVAAMTLPELVQNYQKKQTVSQLKKVYSVLAQAIKRAEVDHGVLSTWPKGADITTEDYFNQYWKPYYKKTKICINPKSCGYATNFPVWKFRNGNGFDWYVESNSSRVAFMLTDGTFIFAPQNAKNDGEIEETDNYVSHFFVDLNGPKNPNTIGIDVFGFTLQDGEALRPLCYDNQNITIRNECSSTGKGVCCAAKIMRDGWEIKEDYPWK